MTSHKMEVGSHLGFLEKKQLSPQALGRDQQVGAGHHGLDLCTSKRGLSQSKCLLETCDRSTKIREFTAGNTR